MKVLFLVSWYPDKFNSISGIFIKRHAQAVSKYADVAVLYVRIDKTITKTYIENTIEEGLKTIKVYYPDNNNSFIKSYYDYIKNSFKGYKLINKEFGKPNIIHVNVLFPAGNFALVLKLLYRIPYVITEHNSNFQGYIEQRLTRIQCYLLLKFASAIMPVSSNLKERIDSFYKHRNCIVIPNIVDTDFFTLR